MTPVPFFTKEQKIKKIELLIQDYNTELMTLKSMRQIWEDNDEPSCDPGLQHQQESKVQEVYDQIKEMSKKL